MSLAIPLIAAPVGVRAQEPNVRDHRAPRWDSRGWERLGETSVDGRNDRDVVHVGRREGAFTTLMLVVEGGDVEMYDVIVTLGGGEQFSPRIRYYFREGTRTNAIDLPGGARGIRDIELHYGGLSGRARVEIWGKAAAPPPPPAAPAWDPRGWERLGETSVDGQNDHDVVHVGRREGAFTALMLVVEGGDVEMYDVVVTLGGGEQFSPRTRYYFREGTRTNAIDLPGGARGIRDIELHYGGLSGRARVEIWGKPGEPAPPPPAWEPRGWRKLGETRVDGRIDRDIVHVRGRQLFRQLVVNIRSSDLEMYDMVITFRDGSRYQPDLRLVFGEGSRSRIIDLPGDLRALRSVGFRYGNLSGSGSARVEVWGR